MKDLPVTDKLRLKSFFRYQGRGTEWVNENEGEKLKLEEENP